MVVANLQSSRLIRVRGLSALWFGERGLEK